MNKFTSREWVMIAIANHFGLDKLSWNDRLNWTKDNIDDLESLVSEAKEPTLYMKAVRALDDALSGTPSGFLVGLDATASGIQIMSALTGCEMGSKLTNLVDTAERRNVYGLMADAMSKKLGKTLTSDDLKKPIMTFFYGSTAQPKKVFGEDTPELFTFYSLLSTLLKGAYSAMQIMQAAWQSDAYYYQWTLPDGHKAKFNVMVPVDKKIEIDELGHSTFTHRAYINEPTKKGLSLAANIVHSIDGFICREMYRRADAQGWELLTIHDSFWCHPNHVEELRQNYNDIFAQYINTALFNSILKELGVFQQYKPLTAGLDSQFKTADYALS